MYFHYFVLVLFVRKARCVGLEIIGDVSFDLRILDQRGDEREERQRAGVGRAREKPTEAPTLECVYQYPEETQVNALLSNMMNQLTKVYTRMRAYVRGEVHTMRRMERRFKVVERDQRDFFDQLYSNMTAEYRRYFNETSQRVSRTGRDPCDHQVAIKQQWRQLLDKARGELEHAASSSAQHLLAVQNRAEDTGAKHRVHQLLTTELASSRTNLLNLLCDDFQLCYNDLF